MPESFKVPICLPSSASARHVFGQANEGVKRIEQLFAKAAHQMQTDMRNLKDDVVAEIEKVKDLPLLFEKQDEFDRKLQIVMETLGDLSGPSISQRFAFLDTELQLVRDADQQHHEALVCTFEALRSLRARLRLGLSEWMAAPRITGQASYQSVATQSELMLRDRALLQSAIHECKEALAASTDGQLWYSDGLQDQITQTGQRLEQLEQLLQRTAQQTIMDLQALQGELKSTQDRVVDSPDLTQAQVVQLRESTDLIREALGPFDPNQSQSIVHRLSTLEADEMKVRDIDQKLAKFNEIQLQLVTDEGFKGQINARLSRLEGHVLSLRSAAQAAPLKQPAYASSQPVYAGSRPGSTPNARLSGSGNAATGQQKPWGVQEPSQSASSGLEKMWSVLLQPNRS